METEYFEKAKAARRAEIEKLLAEIDEKEKKPHLSTGGEPLNKAKLIREMAEIDGIPFSD